MSNPKSTQPSKRSLGKNGLSANMRGTGNKQLSGTPGASGNGATKKRGGA